VHRDNPRDRRAVVQFYNRQNLGDDLLVKLLVSRYDTEFALPRTASRSLSLHPGVTMIDRPMGSSLVDRVRSKLSIEPTRNHPELARAARERDALIHIGGSIFIEHERALPFWEREAEYYATLRRPYFIIDANFGPYRSAKFPDLIRRILGEAEDVCLRDVESYERFADLGNVRLAPDAGFTIQPTTSDTVADAVISVMDLRSTHGEATANSYERACAEAVRSLVDSGKSVCLMSFCQFQGDAAAAERIRSLAGAPRPLASEVRIYEYSGDLDDAIGVLSNAGMIIGTRFHAIVIGLALGVPTLPIVYSRKTANMLNEIGYSGPIFDLTAGNLAAPLLESTPQALNDVESIRTRAELQFAGTDAYFGGTDF
jgi:colanic acid/amylovoran biosynthesis protein